MFLEAIELTEQTVNIMMMSIWVSIFVLALIVEFATSELVSIWFCAGSLGALIFTFIPGVPFFVEIIVFFVISAALLFALRPLSKKLLAKKIQETSMNIDAIIGRKGIIIKPIKPLEAGEVRIDSVIWTCLSLDEDETIENESVVKVAKVVGNRLYVTKINEGESK